MRETMLNPLSNIISLAETLLLEEDFNELQRKFLQSIRTDGLNLYDLLVSIPDLNWERAREVLSYESRSNLDSIIGYSELLLEETEGELSQVQKQYLAEMRASGIFLLSRLAQL